MLHLVVQELRAGESRIMDRILCTKDNIPPIEEATERKPYGLRIF
jgi:hypothetical protein